MKDFSYLDNVKNSGIKKLAGLEFENRRSLKVIDEKNQSNFFIPKINRTTDSLIKNRTYDKLDNISKKENCSIDMRKIENKKSNNNSEITKPLLNSRFHFNTPQYTIFDRNQIKKTQIDLFNAWKNQTLKTTNYKKKINSMNKILKNTIKKDERFFFDKRELQKPSIILGVLTLHDGFPKRVENLAKYQSQKKHFYLEQITEEGYFFIF